MGADGILDEFLQQEYKQWEKAHAKMKDSPPPDGHDYLKHANNLLVLLEGVSELHPIAKAVVVSFKAAVMFEQDRRENDARVTAVFLAQTDVMRVLLDVDDLATRRRQRSDVNVLRTSTALGDILLEIQKEIKSCGNSIDTYYKESRFVKFWKAQDWKSRMLGHINRFNKFRLELQQSLSIQVASGVEDIVWKMDAVLSRLYSPKHDWEKNLDLKTRGPEFRDLSWMDDHDTLQTLLWDTNDPSLSILPPTGSAADISVQMASQMQLSKVKKEIQLSLDALCDRNMDMFELRLSFHAKQMEQAIVNSAHLVIQSLSGPSDRLVNEDLQQLWKEMDWIFCVENKFFVSALFEFYLDRFSSHKFPHKFLPHEDETNVDTSEKALDDSFSKYLSSSVAAPRFSFLSKLGALNHPDSWTLEYIALHGHHITRAIDNDSSGFIRISEANAFTYQIPKGWSLPQWCAYSAAGWAYEARIYRRRIGKLMEILTDMQPKVLASNRTYLIVFSLINFYATYHAFTREPLGQNIPPPTPELRELVKQKVLEQDALYRGHLQTLRWTVEDESTLHLLYGEIAPEKYILQFGTLMLEQFLAVANLSRTVTIDAKDWFRLSSAFRVMREISVKRVSELKARFETEQNESESIATYHGGIWSFVRQNLDTEKFAEGMTPYSGQELAGYLADLPLLNDFLIPTDHPPYLQHQTWEEYIKTLDPADVPSVIPKTWNPLDDTALPHLVDRAYIVDFPMTGWNCDRCGRNPVQQKRYRCLHIDCPDFDLCIDCFSLPQSEHNAIHHKFDHPVMLCTLWLMPEQEQRIALEIELVLEHLQQEINALQRSQSSDVPAVLEHVEEVQKVLDPEETLTENKEAPEIPGPPTVNNDQGDTQKTQQDTENAEHPESPQDTIEGGTKTQSVSIGEGGSEATQETRASPTEESMNEEEPNRTEFAKGDSAASLTSTADGPQVYTPPEGPEPSPEEGHGTQLTRDEDEKPLMPEASLAVASPESTAQLPTSKRFTCGRCSATISLGTDFFRCVGHVCQDYFICSKCGFERFETDDEAAHQWWHSLFLLKKDLLVDSSSSSLPSTEVVVSDNLEEIAVAQEVPAVINVDAIHDRMSKLEEKLLLLDSAIHSSNFALETKLLESNSALEAKVDRLEAKLDNMMTAVTNLIGGLVQHTKTTSD